MEFSFYLLQRKPLAFVKVAKKHCFHPQILIASLILIRDPLLSKGSECEIIMSIYWETIDLEGLSTAEFSTFPELINLIQLFSSLLSLL